MKNCIFVLIVLVVCIGCDNNTPTPKPNTNDDTTKKAFDISGDYNVNVRYYETIWPNGPEGECIITDTTFPGNVRYAMLTDSSITMLLSSNYEQNIFDTLIQYDIENVDSVKYKKNRYLPIFPPQMNLNFDASTNFFLLTVSSENGDIIRTIKN